MECLGPFSGRIKRLWPHFLLLISRLSRRWCAQGVEEDASSSGPRAACGMLEVVNPLGGATEQKGRWVEGGPISGPCHAKECKSSLEGSVFSSALS